MNDNGLRPESVFKHMRDLRATMGWQILVKYMNAERERIISDGKKYRSEEKRIATWARLDGFDSAATLAERLEKINHVQEKLETVDLGE